MKNPLSLDGLIDWLRSQDPQETYDFVSVTDCLCYRYFRAVGLPVDYVVPGMWSDHAGSYHKYPYELNDVANGRGPKFTSCNGRNYGAALERALMLKALM